MTQKESKSSSHVPPEFHKVVTPILAVIGLGYTFFGQHWIVGICGTIYLMCLIWAGATIYSNRRADWVESLRETGGYAPLYEMFMAATLRRLSPLFGHQYDPETKRSLPQWARYTFTYALLDRALLIAVAYPVLLMLTAWIITGQDTTLGTAVILPADQTGGQRYWLLLPFTLLILHPSWRNWASAHSNTGVSACSDGLYWTALVLLFLIGFLTDINPVAFAFAVVVAFAGAFAFAFAVVVAFAGAVAVVVAVVVAFAGAVAIDWLLERKYMRAAALLAIGYPALAILALLHLLPWQNTGDNARAIFLFVALLPLINALFDTVSYGITFTLTQWGLQRGGGWALFAGLVDAVLALLLFLGLGAVLVLVAAYVNAVTGVVFVDLAGLLGGLSDWQSYWWVYAMIFTAALPTGIHLLISLAALQALFIRRFRLWLADQLDLAAQEDWGAAILGTLGLSGLWYLSLALPLAAICGLSWALWTAGLSAYGVLYVEWLTQIAAWAGVV